MWNYHDRNDKQDISLHDCHATKAYIEGDDLVLEFEDGFWIDATNIQNPFCKLLQTDTSQLRFCRYDALEIYSFHEFRIVQRPVSTIRKSISPEVFIQNINSGKWQLEFISEYHEGSSLLFHCWLWFEKRPYHRECQVMIDCDHREYGWNSICEDKPW